MTTATQRSAFLRGARDSLPFVLVLVPFSMLFGVVGTEAGLDLAQVLGFSVLVIAGAAQLTALQLMTEQAPAVIVLASALAVNLRMAMYSASLAPWLGAAPLWQRALAAYLLVDNSYAQSLAEYEARPQMAMGERIAFFAGSMILIAPLWYLGTLAGALAGRDLASGLPLDFALPIMFLALTAPALRTVGHLAAAGTAIVLSLLLAGLPYNLGLLPAAIAGMAVGAEVERRGLAHPLRREAS